MKAHIASLALSLFYTSSLLAATDIYFGEDRSPFEPGPIGPNDVPRLNYTNSQRVAAQFLSRLPGVTTESFEGFASGSSPTTLTFGTNIATLSGTREIETMLDPALAPRGGFPTTGTNCFILNTGSGGSFTVTFSTPQAAFGFYGTDVEVNQFTVRLIHETVAPSDIPVPVVVPQGSGGVFFFGVIDKDRPFTAVDFQSIGTSGEVFFFDDLTIAVPAQVHPEPASLEIALDAGVRIAGTIGATYRLECATEPDLTNWMAVTNIVLSTSPFLFFDTDCVTSHVRRVYRAVTLE